MNPKPYTDSDRSNRLWWYLLLITLLSAFCYITLDVWLLPCSIAYHETGTMTAGYLLYAAIGLLFSTPTPFIAVLIISLFIEKIGIRQMFLNIFRTEEKLKTVLIADVIQNLNALFHNLSPKATKYESTIIVF